MEYLMTFLGPVLKEKSVWVSIAGWVINWANKKYALGFDANLVSTLSLAMSTWALTHIVHVNTAGAPAKTEETK